VYEIPVYVRDHLCVSVSMLGWTGTEVQSHCGNVLGACCHQYGRTAVSVAMGWPGTFHCQWCM